jgi:hypothetical protein
VSSNERLILGVYPGGIHYPRLHTITQSIIIKVDNPYLVRDT